MRTELTWLQLALNWVIFEGIGGTIIYNVRMLGEHWVCPWQIRTYSCSAYNTIISYFCIAFSGYFFFLSNKTGKNVKREGEKGKGKMKSSGYCICFLPVEPQFLHL